MSASPADNVNFTPYVAPLEQEARAKLRELFMLEENAAVSWHLLREDRLHVVLGDPQAPILEFDLERLNSDTRAWYKGNRLALSYRKGRQGEDPMEDATRRNALAAVRKRVEVLDERGWEEGLLAETLKALHSVKEFEEVEEYYFRQARPRELIIRLGFRCNQDCWFC